MNDFPDSQPWPRLDMEAVTREALGLRRWRCEFTCDGTPYTMTVEAANESAAGSRALHELRGEPGFSAQRAMLTACVQV